MITTDQNGHTYEMLEMTKEQIKEELGFLASYLSGSKISKCTDDCPACKQLAQRTN